MGVHAKKYKVKKWGVHAKTIYIKEGIWQQKERGKWNIRKKSNTHMLNGKL